MTMGMANATMPGSIKNAAIERASIDIQRRGWLARATAAAYAQTEWRAKLLLVGRAIFVRDHPGTFVDPGQFQIVIGVDRIIAGRAVSNLEV